MLWIANRDSGSFDDLKKIILWLTRQDNVDNPFIWETINGLHNLGYIQKDAASGEWKALGQELVIIPGKDGLGMLTGCFNRRNIVESEFDHGFWPTFVPASTDPQLAKILPKTIYIEASSMNDYFDYQRETGCRFLNVEAELSSIASHDPLSLREVVAPPRYDTGTLERFDIRELSYFPCSDGAADGLYKQRVYGRLKYWIRSDGTWFLTDRGLGPWLWNSLSREVHEEQRLVWYNESTESIYFNRKLALPAKLERLLVLCSGVLPIGSRHSRRFDNLSPFLAQTIFEYLKLEPRSSVR